ncbi:MAG: HPF/RaiA family ribosome-associated protein [Rhodocyclaceae bacterium]|nr:HPF/RaiA family ribosome-associated protein [Rhodocyclaceae bacterium]
MEQHIREKAAKLETFYPNIIGCHVTVELPHVSTTIRVSSTTCASTSRCRAARSW